MPSCHAVVRHLVNCASACVCVCVCVCARAQAITIVLLIYSCMSLTDIYSGILEYFLDEHIEMCSVNTFVVSYPSCEVVRACIDCFL